jgi:peptidylprolyl isomerase
MKKKNLVLVFLLSIFSVNLVSAKGKVESGDLVGVEYTGKLTTDGRVFDSNVGQTPLEFVVGQKSLLPKFEEALLGMKENQSKTVSIPAAEAYGTYDSNKIVKVPKAKLPEKAKPGDVLTVQTPNGNFPVTFVELKEEDAFIDTNHVLAGKDLTFDIKLVSVTKAKDIKPQAAPEASPAEPKAAPAEGQGGPMTNNSEEPEVPTSPEPTTEQTPIAAPVETIPAN